MFCHFKNSKVYNRLPNNVKAKVSSLESRIKTKFSTNPKVEGDEPNLNFLFKHNPRLANRLIGKRE
jgi:hypothetical protein